MTRFCMPIPRSSYNLFKTSSSKFLLIVGSQARHLQSGNLIILSLPGASANHFLRLSSLKEFFDTIILSIGGNDLYYYTTPTDTPLYLVADKIIGLANFLCERAKTFPEHGENKTRSNGVNDIRKATSEHKQGRNA